MLTKLCTGHHRLATSLMPRSLQRYSTQSHDVADLHQAALTGDKEMLQRVLVSGGTEQINRTDKRGRTAIMEAARSGHSGMLQTILSHGADVSRRCKSGHTAVEFAQFYKQKDCYNILSAASPASPSTQPNMFFCATPNIGRAAELREDSEKLTEQLRDSKTRFLLLHKLSPVTRPNTKGNRLCVVWATFPEICHLLELTEPTELYSMAILLGVYNPNSIHMSSSPMVLEKGAALFTVDVSSINSERLEGLGDSVNVAPGVMGMLTMRREEAALCAQARSMVDWHQKNKFCSVCGSGTSSSEGGYKLICSNTTCSTRKGVHNISHPRVDPSVISLVVNSEQGGCILARGHHFPPGMYSCVAGFVEPGESVENACRREVQEEVGVSLGEVTYVSSQPWPSPSALMLGCIAQADTTTLKVDSAELEDARWFKRQEVVEMITRCHSERLFVPPHHAIAHYLVKIWLIQTAFSQTS